MSVNKHLQYKIEQARRFVSAAVAATVPSVTSAFAQTNGPAPSSGPSSIPALLAPPKPFVAPSGFGGPVLGGSFATSRRVFLPVALALCMTGTAVAQGTNVVTDGKFTNVYVFPDPDTETWDDHMKSLRSADAPQFFRASIDGFTQALMNPVWPSYFDPLFQYSGINPPLFFGSSVVSRQCVDAALNDENNGVLQWDTIRSLANCHTDGMDPSPQINLIFSPDIQIAAIVPFGTGPDMCTTSMGNAWHAWGINTPNFTVLPTSPACMPTFTSFTQAMSHEIVETLSDPGGTGFGTLGSNEVGDLCSGRPDGFATFAGSSVARYWSNFDQDCLPRLDPGPDSMAQTWVLGTGSPLVRFTGDTHILDLKVPPSRAITNAPATQLLLVVQTGDDDLRGGNDPTDNANVILNFTGGRSITANINRGRTWNKGETHAALLTLPSPAPRVSDITGITLITSFGGGCCGDNWNVNKVALIVSYPTGSVVIAPKLPVIHAWLDASGGPLVRFTGDVHDQQLAVPAADVGMSVQALNLIISTGNDDLRGGSNLNDDCNVTVQLTSGESIIIPNVNGGQTWDNWSNNTVTIPVPAGGLKGGDIKSITLHTNFGGGCCGDNWNVNRVQLQATLAN